MDDFDPKSCVGWINIEKFIKDIRRPIIKNCLGDCHNKMQNLIHGIKRFVERHQLLNIDVFKC